jgi:hypothetical protein
MSTRCILIILLLAGSVIAEDITSPLVGTYSAILPAADAAGRVVMLQLLANGEATMTTQFIASGEPIVEIGKWTVEGSSAVVTFSEVNGKKESKQITWALEGDKLLSTKYDCAQYGSAGLPLQRSSTGQLVKAQYDGISLRVDSWLAKSVQGATIPATPVEDGPQLGGAPVHIRFTFNSQNSDRIDPYQPQILIFPLKALKKLHPSVAQEVKALQQLLEDKPDSVSQSIPVFPLYSAAQVFQTHIKYFFFENGGGIRFLTYYAQEVAPIRSDHLLYCFQGLTSNGSWYVSASWPVNTNAIPEGNQKMNAAEYDAFAKQMDNYLSKIIGTLEATASGGFIPDLKVLDQMIQSLNVAPKNLK